MTESYSDQILKAVIAQFKELRTSQGMSHEALAKKAGVTRPAISHIENGNRKPSFLLCLRLAEALNLSLGSIISGVERNLRKTRKIK